MKNSIITASLFCLLLSAGACKKHQAETDNRSARSVITDAFLKIPGTTGSGKIAVVNDLTQTRYGVLSSQYHFEGTFTDGESFSEVSFNNYSIPVVNNAFEMSSAVDSPALKGNEGNYFGTGNEIRLGSSILTPNFYAPRPVQLSFSGPGANNYEFLKSGGISFSFQTDPMNPRPIIVVIEYVPQLAGPGTMPTTRTFNYPPGTTSGFISASDLSDFPTNADLVMYAGAGNEMNFVLNGKTYTVTALSITYIPGIRLF